MTGKRRSSIAMLIGLTVLIGGDPVRSQSIGSPAPTFSDVVAFVRKEGWEANLRSFCTQLQLPTDNSNCVFKQVSVEETKGRGDPRGFNVPAISGGTISYVLIYHLGPLVGEFFIVSPEGELIRAFYRSKGTGYNPIPNSAVEQEFTKDRAYWIDNFSGIKSALALERSQKQ